MCWRFLHFRFHQDLTAGLRHGFHQNQHAYLLQAIVVEVVAVAVGNIVVAVVVVIVVVGLLAVAAVVVVGLVLFAAVAVVVVLVVEEFALG